MKWLRKLETALNLYRSEGIHKIIAILKTQYGIPIPQTLYSNWRVGISSEVQFWDSFLRTKGLQWSNDYLQRLDPATALQDRPAALLPDTATEVHILDVGAGPLTYLGKTHPGKSIHITAVDPLAYAYDQLLEKHGITPLVRTQPLAAEKIKKAYNANCFDLVFARNCIDHSYNPEKAILQMLFVTKPGAYLLMEHIPNEAENENWHGLHQWNFSMSENGDFLIGSRRRVVNMSRKYMHIAEISCELADEGDGRTLLITRMRKRGNSRS